MNHKQKQMIKEAYEDGYYDALNEQRLPNPRGPRNTRSILQRIRDYLIRQRGIRNTEGGTNTGGQTPDTGNPEPKPPIVVTSRRADPNSPTDLRDPFGRPTSYTAREDDFLREVEPTVSRPFDKPAIKNLERQLYDEMGDDALEIIRNARRMLNSPEDLMDYYRQVLRMERRDLPDIDNPLDDIGLTEQRRPPVGQTLRNMRRVREILKNRAIRASRGTDDIVPTSGGGGADDIVRAVQNTIPIGGDTKKLAQQIITIYKNDPNALKRGNIVVIKTRGEPVAADVYGGTVKIVQQPENPNVIIGNIAIDVVDEGAEQIRRYGTKLGDASITLQGLDGDILILPDSQIDGIIFVDPKELDRLYPGLDKRINNRTRDLLRRMGGGSGSGGVGPG